MYIKHTNSIDTVTIQARKTDAIRVKWCSLGTGWTWINFEKTQALDLSKFWKIATHTLDIVQDIMFVAQKLFFFSAKKSINEIACGREILSGEIWII